MRRVPKLASNDADYGRCQIADEALGMDRVEFMRRKEMSLITAKITIPLPFRTTIKEGELYEVIEKT